MNRDPTPDGIRVVQLVLGAISSILDFREWQSCVTKKEYTEPDEDLVLSGTILTFDLDPEP